MKHKFTARRYANDSAGPLAFTATRDGDADKVSCHFSTVDHYAQVSLSRAGLCSLIAVLLEIKEDWE